MQHLVLRTVDALDTGSAIDVENMSSLCFPIHWRIGCLLVINEGYRHHWEVCESVT